MDPIAVTVEPGLEVTGPEPLRLAYWIGTFPESPRQNIVLGGVTFCRGLGQADAQGRLQGPRGAIVHLSEAELESVKKAVADRVVRWAGRRAQILTRRAPTQYRAAPGDVPLAQYLYCIPVAEAAALDPVAWRTQRPPPMWPPRKPEDPPGVPWDDDAKPDVPEPTGPGEPLEGPEPDYEEDDRDRPGG
jgi:hypothetical protein